MPDEPDEFEEWEADEFEEIDDDPIATPAEVATVEAPIVARHKRVKPDGNTKRINAGDARRQATLAAQGRGPGPTEEWRDELAMGNRGKAASLLGKGGSTHNSGSGFGLG